MMISATIATLPFFAVLVGALPLSNAGHHYLVKCTITDEKQQAFLSDQVINHGLDLWSEHVPSAPSEVTILATEAQLGKLQETLQCAPATDIETIEKSLLQPNAPSAAQDFFADYRSYRDILTKLGSYKSTSDMTITMQTMGRSHELRLLNVLRFYSTTARPSRKLWISCGQHAREWIAPASCMHMIDTIVQTGRTNPRIATMLSRFQVFIAPLLNPDGYEYSRTKYRYWRKNRRSNGWGRYGVDLNRNWPGKWGTVGTSDNPSSDIFRGPSAGSEPEVNATVTYINSLNGIDAGVDVHSYGELILRNYGWTTDPCPNEHQFAMIGDRIARNMGRIHGTEYISQRSGELYPAMGAMDDWFYERGHAMGMTFELRDKGRYGFLLPAKFIVPVGEELLEGVLTLSETLLVSKNSKL